MHRMRQKQRWQALRVDDGSLGFDTRSGSHVPWVSSDAKERQTARRSLPSARREGAAGRLLFVSIGEALLLGVLFSLGTIEKREITSNNF